MANFYCEYCGMKCSSVSSLTSGSCSRSPTRRHSLYEGSEKPKDTCKYCGMQSSSISSLTSGSCSKSPTKRHHPAL